MLARHIDPSNCQLIEAIGELQRDEFDYFLNRASMVVHRVSTEMLVALDDHDRAATILTRYAGRENEASVALAIIADRSEATFVNIPAVPCGRMRREIRLFVERNQSHRASPWFNVAIRENCLSLYRFEEMLNTYPALKGKWQTRKQRLCLEVALEWSTTL